MKEEILKTIQKFLNTQFFYTDLLKCFDKQKDFLLKPEILERIEDCEYNAIWDTMLEIQKMLLYANSPNLIIGAHISVLNIFNQNLKERQYRLTNKE